MGGDSKSAAALFDLSEIPNFGLPRHYSTLRSRSQLSAVYHTPSAVTRHTPIAHAGDAGTQPYICRTHAGQVQDNATLIRKRRPRTQSDTHDAPRTCGGEGTHVIIVGWSAVGTLAYRAEHTRHV